MYRPVDHVVRADPTTDPNRFRSCIRAMTARSISCDDGSHPTSMSSGLQFGVPVPTKGVSWVGGWRTEKGTLGSSNGNGHASRMKELHAVRSNAIERLFAASVRADPSECMKQEAIVALDNYAAALKKNCLEPPGILVRRNMPMLFEWCFRGEESSTGHTTVATMRSSMPAFECLVVMVASAMLQTPDVNSAAESAQSVQRWEQGMRAWGDILRELETHTLFGEGQWARTKRQSVPNVLTEEYARYEIARLKRNIAIVNVCVPGTRNCAISARMRQVYEACSHLVNATRCLLLRPFLNNAQLPPIQQTYDTHVVDLVRWKLQHCMFDADLAASEMFNRPAYAVTLVRMARECIHVYDEQSPQFIQFNRDANRLLQICEPAVTTPATVDDVEEWRSRVLVD